MRETVIEVNQVTRRYRIGDTVVTALDQVSLTVASGEFVAIEGPSGCGKSTLLAILGLLDVPDSGSYVLAGAAVQALSFKDRARLRNRYVGIVFQAFNLIGHLSVFENIRVPLNYSTQFPTATHRQRVLDVLGKVGMLDRAQHYPHELSGGQQQRVAIARALVTDPAIIIADEPTGNLDSVLSESIMALFAELNVDGVTVLMVTHDAGLAAHAHRRIAMKDGRVVAECRGQGGGAA